MEALSGKSGDDFLFFGLLVGKNFLVVAVNHEQLAC